MKVLMVFSIKNQKIINKVILTMALVGKKRKRSICYDDLNMIEKIEYYSMQSQYDTVPYDDIMHLIYLEEEKSVLLDKYGRLYSKYQRLLAELDHLRRLNAREIKAELKKQKQ